jgi:hypothetical protein
MESVSSMCRESARSIQQDVEKGPHLCSRIVLSLNVPPMDKELVSGTWAGG